MVYTSGMGSGLLTEEAEAMGKITIGSELGFGASTDYLGCEVGAGRYAQCDAAFRSAR